MTQRAMIIDDSKAMRSGMPGPSRCCWPTTSPRVRGRRRSGRGWCGAAGAAVGMDGL